MDISITKKQKAFLDATAAEVLFGGAAGGGKSYAQIIDAFLYALRYPKSKQLILRRTFPELERSLIRTALEIYPQGLYKYNAGKHHMEIKNGSLIEFGYCDNPNDVYKYQSAEYDVIRFDELTHFTEDMYIYLISRCRGANEFPKQIKSSTNPGGVGHTFVKARFIDIGPAGEVHETPTGTRVFIPAKVTENKFLMEADPGYIKRLENLNEADKKALLFGEWDIFDGQYFAEFDRATHVIQPFEMPSHWRRYFVMDYGLDMLAGYWIAVDTQGKAYVYREIYHSGLIVSDAIALIKANTQEDIYQYIAPPDLWNRKSDTGKSTIDWFAGAGMRFTKASNDRVQGWLAVKEYLKPYKDEQGNRTARLQIFNNCTNLIRTLPAIQYDKRNPNDTAHDPHELTHAPDAIRYFIAMQPRNAQDPAKKPLYNFGIEKPKPDPLGRGGKAKII